MALKDGRRSKEKDHAKTKPSTGIRLLIGRKTYDIFAAHRPCMEKEPPEGVGTG